MRFFREKKYGEFDVTPYCVNVDGLHLSYMDEDAVPVIVYANKVVWGGRGCEHDSIEIKHGEKNEKLLARYWIKSHVLAIWSFLGEGTNTEREWFACLADSMKKHGINPNNVILYLEFYVENTPEHDAEAFIIEFTLQEYLSINIGGEPNEFFWHMMNRETKIQNEPQTITKNGMNAKDVWRHYEVQETIRLTEQDLRDIVNSVIKEYHQHQQLMLPFDGSDEPYNYMQFLEWLDEHSTNGKLPSEPGLMERILEDKKIFYEVGISSFYYGTSSEFDTEYYYEFLKELVGNGPGVFKEGNTVDTVIDIIPDVESTKDYLTPEGYRLWYDALIKKGEKTMRWWLENRIHINEETGLIYVERAMDLESLFGRYHDNYDNDYYETLEDNYSGIGEYWSYAYGGGNVYFYSAQHPDNVIVRGWVSPLSVDWGATISLDSMDEQELRLNYDTVVQIDKIEAWDNENGKINLLGNRGSVLMKIM